MSSHAIIQLAGKMIIKDVDIGIIAIFDGHNGAEASEMATKLLMEYFLLHVYFQLDGLYSVTLEKLNGRLTFKDAELLHQLQPYGCIDKERCIFHSARSTKYL